MTVTPQDIIKIDERIDAFLKGTMSMEEEHQFLLDLRTDKDLRARAHLTALLAKALKI